MPGGYSPAPFSPGAAQGTSLEALTNALAEAQGTALSDERDSYIMAEIRAEARAIWYLWSLGQRFSNSFVPRKMTQPMLDRWFRIYGLPKRQGLSDADKRTMIARKVMLTGQNPCQQVVDDLIAEICGATLVAVHRYKAADGALSSIEGGLSISGGQTLADGPYSSHIHNISIELTQPTGMTDAQFKAIRDDVDYWLGEILPAWDTWCTYTNDATGLIGFRCGYKNVDFAALT